MAVFYHIDRNNWLKEGQIVDLVKYNDIKGEDAQMSALLQNKVDTYFPNGVSSHGNRYFLQGTTIDATSTDIELIFELVRRNQYSDINSRFQSLFAVEKENIITMINNLRANPNTVSIYEVESEEYFKGDMKLLGKSTNLLNCICADLYWQGKTLGNPLYEILMKPPIKVLRKVDIREFLR